LKIAVVGAGITGLGAAWLAGTRHAVVLFEAEARLGGHSNTVDVVAPEGTIPIDTGFIVYNPPSYPNLVALFDRLGVPTAASDMSFAVSFGGGAYEYSGSGLAGFLGQRRNALRPSHWRLGADVLRFHREAKALLTAAEDTTLTLGDWLAQRGYSDVFVERHILPMAAAIWSATARQMLAFPAAAFARFFDNHQLLQASGHPLWRTVVGGSRAYVARLRSELTGPVLTGDPVVAVTPGATGVEIATRSGHRERFDRVALCCHADEARGLLAARTPTEDAVLGAFGYADNEAVLHTDASFMPRRRAVWSSWNYVGRDAHCPLTVTYWMNRLQPLATATPHFVTLNPARPLALGTRIAAFRYTHPLFDAAAMRAQALIWPLQGQRGVWYAGAHLGYGFHEDGLQAGLTVAEHMTRDDGPVVRPWAAQALDPAFTGRLRLPRTTGAAPHADGGPIPAAREVAESV
jgi:predicted NAD/FAD-binding protein